MSAKLEMNLEQEFDRRIAALHGLDGSLRTNETAGGAMDIRQAELGAMADVFLGEDYDPVKRKHIGDLQLAMRQQQLALSRRLKEGSISAAAFADASNALIADTFQKCEAALGEDDFRRLFGTTRQQLSQVIDRETFLANHSAKSGVSAPVTVYTNFCRLSVTPEELILDFGLNTQLTPLPKEPVQLTNRVIMSYYTAKRLCHALQTVISQHEQAYGQLELDFQRRIRAAASTLKTTTAASS